MPSAMELVRRAQERADKLHNVGFSLREQLAAKIELDRLLCDALAEMELDRPFIEAAEAKGRYLANELALQGPPFCHSFLNGDALLCREYCKRREARRKDAE